MRFEGGPNDALRSCRPPARLPDKLLVPKAIDGVPVKWLNSHYLNVEPLVARTYGAIPPSLPFSHYRFAERARRFGRSDRLAKHLHKVIDTTGGVPHLSDAAVSNMECGAACP